MTRTTSAGALVRRIRESVIGDDHQLPGPYGPRRITYADHTASGRALTFVEDLVRERVLPFYANTHTESSGTGTITYVHAAGQHYLDDPTHREEGGTPAIVESIRAGLVFGLKQAVGAATIRDRETRFVRRAIRSWRANPAIELLGDLDADRLPIVSFRVRPPGHRRLHHNFVVALLNDLFGIQSRGGCSCAGPYGHRLLAIDSDRAHALARQAVDGWLGIKPGWTRLSFSFYLAEAELDFIVEAVHLVATHGIRLLPEYRFDPRSGLWRHRHPAAPLPGLREVRFDADDPARRSAGGHRRAPDSALAGYLREARAILAAHPLGNGHAHAAALPGHLERLRWFELPGACLTSDPGRLRGTTE